MTNLTNGHTNPQNFAWIDKFRPRTIDDLIATDDTKKQVEGILRDGISNNKLFIGRPGIGKTAIARLIVELLDADYTVINASLKGNIDTLRNEIQQFAGSVSLSGNHKYVILDEADYLNPNSTQPALRNFIDTYTVNCGFFATANYANRLIEPLRERFQIEEFKISKKDLPVLIMQATKRVMFILDKENVPYEKDAVARFVATNAPNWRGVILKVQQYAQRHQKIDAGILTSGDAADFNDLIPALREKDFGRIRQWVAINADDSSQELFTELAEVLTDVVIPQSVPDVIITLARYQYQAAFVADQQINFAACLAEIMVQCQFR